MLSYEEALAKILDAVGTASEEESVPLLNAVGRVLAHPIDAPEDVPNYDNSAMDGYAVLAEDTAGATDEAPAILETLEEIQAGRLPSLPVRKGTASRIMTGSVVPEGCDAIVMVEKTEKLDGGRVKVLAPARKGDHIRRAGEDVRKGSRVFEAGRRVRPRDLGMLALLGCARIDAFRRPRVAVVATGDEVLEIDRPSKFGFVRNSNSYALCALCDAIGAESVYFGILPDSKDVLLEGFGKAAEECDAVLTSGGVSMGDYDIVREALDELGRIDFWKSNIKPGKPLAFGQIRGKPFFSLPGNPVSAAVNFDLFARPALEKMAGVPYAPPELVPARLETPIREKPGRRKFIRGIYSAGPGGFAVRTTGAQGSAVYSSIVLANCYIVVPEETGDMAVGETVNVLRLDV